MNISKGQIVAIVCFLLMAICFLASKMVVWRSARKLVNWEEVLLGAVSNANEIAVYKGEGILVAVCETNQLQSFFDAITIDESVTEYIMMPGDLSISFKDSGKIVLSIELVGDKHLRWQNGGWPSDAKLTDSSSVALKQWLASHAVESSPQGAEGSSGSESSNP